MSTRSSPPLGALAFALLLAACGDRERERETNAPPNRAAPSIEDTDELIALQIRSVREDDRPVATAAQSDSTAVAREGPSESPEVAAELAMLDPGADWQSERLSAAAARQLRRLFSEDPPDITATGFAGADLRPDRLARQEIHGGVTVLRAAIETPARAAPAASLADALTGLRAAFADGTMEASVKPVGVEVGAEGFSATLHVELRGVDGAKGTRRQINAVWHTGWSDDEPPLLRSLEVRRHEESLGGTANGLPMFADATRAVLAGTPRFRSQVLTGIDFWASRLTRLGDFSMTGHHGLAVGDVNGDGLEDLFACDAGSLPNRLYVQQPDGTLRDHSAASGLDWHEDSRSALLVDLDNDGDQDLVVATIAMIAFAENDGAGRFTLRGGHPGAPYPFSLSAADFDNDGLLDVYACVYSAGDDASARGFEAASPLPFHDAENGGRNVLLRNLGAFRFTDVTARAGLDADNTRWSFAAAWEDMDRDGDPDLYVANDFGRNCLYRNDGGRFVQIAAQAGVEDMASGMSVAWGDSNRDGAPDLHVGNMFSAAGNRVSYQRAFAQGGDANAVAGLQRMARGNSLFEADGAGGFRDVSIDRAAHLGLWAWSSGFADINNDGWEDLAISNGYLTGRRPDDL